MQDCHRLISFQVTQRLLGCCNELRPDLHSRLIGGMSPTRGKIRERTAPNTPSQQPRGLNKT